MKPRDRQPVQNNVMSSIFSPMPTFSLVCLVLAGFALGCASSSSSPSQQSSTPPPSPSTTPSASQPPPGAPEQNQATTAPAASGEAGRKKPESTAGAETESQASVAPPPPAGDGTETAASGSGGQQAKTRAEREAELKEEFDRSLAVFDERLAREQEELGELGDRQAAAQRNQSGSGREEGLPASGSGEEEGEYGYGGAPLPPGDYDPDQPEAERQTSSVGGATRNNLPPPPADIPSGQDDDVVARQLREAAENETDPELRKKLWEEYRQYKRGSR